MGSKVYLVIVLIRLLYSGMHIIQKAAFNGGMNTFVFVFYRQLFATAILVPFAFILERDRAPPLTFILCLKLLTLSFFGSTATLNLSSVALNYTSANFAAATINSIPVVTFILAAILRVEHIKVKRLSGMLKIFGVGLCLPGILVIAFYEGFHLQSFNHHHLLGYRSKDAVQINGISHSNKKQVLGTFIMTVSNTTWSLWLVLQGYLSKEYPCVLHSIALQCLFSTIQSFFLALIFKREFSQWELGFNMRLLSVAYSGIIINGVSYYLQSWCIAKRGPVFLAASTPLSLIFTMTLSFLLGESISLGSVLGGILMVGGLYFVLWGKWKEQIDDNLLLVKDEKVNLEEKEMLPSTLSNQEA